MKYLKLFLPLLFLIAVCFFQAAHSQIMQRHTPENYQYPWRVHFAYMENGDIAYGYMNVSWSTRDLCTASEPDIIAAKDFPFKLIGIWCRKDGTRT